MLKKFEPKVYSYIRFSTPEQSQGNSLKRQLVDTERLAKSLGLKLDDSLKPDEGKSGYHGHHRTKGNLGEFLRLVKAGDVAPGSALVVENIDRLGREGTINMLREIIFKLWDHGITLYTVAPYAKYPPEKQNDLATILPLFVELARAHAESQRKSEMKKKSSEIARELARKHKRPWSRNCPGWLEVVGTTDDGLKMNQSREYRMRPKAKNTLRKIFEWYLAGHGTRTIATKLNDLKSAWVPQRHSKQKTVGWRSSYVAKLLGNRELIGEHQPHKMVDDKRQPEGKPIEDYYPKMIDKKLFFAVQDRRKTMPKNIGGRTGKHGNLFTGLAHCAYCGGVMRFVDKGQPPKGQKYLICDNGVRHLKCQRHSIRYDEVENTLLANCVNLDPAEVLPTGGATDRAARVAGKRIAGLRGEANDNERQTANLAAEIADTDNATARKALAAHFEKLGKQREDLETGINRAEDEYRNLTNAETNIIEWQQTFDGLVKALDNAPAIRGRMKNHLPQLIERIDVFATGDINNPLWKYELEENLEHFMICNKIPDDRFKGFERRIEELLETKNGRFLRVKFRTGMEVDLVPDDSLAPGVKRLVRQPSKRKRKMADYWLQAAPDLDECWKKYKRKRL